MHFIHPWRVEGDPRLGSLSSGRKRGMGKGLVGKMAREQESGLRGDTRVKCGFPCALTVSIWAEVDTQDALFSGVGVGSGGMGMRGRTSV